MRFPEDDDRDVYADEPDLVLSVEQELSEWERDIETLHITASRLDLDHARDVLRFRDRVRRFRHKLPARVGAA